MGQFKADFSGLSTSDIQALFKIKYEKLSQNIYNSANVMLGRVKKSYDFVGEEMRIAIPQSFSGGVGSGSLPKANKAKYGKARLFSKKVYARVDIDRETIKAASKDEGAFVRAMNEVVKKAVESYNRNLSRILFNDGSGELGKLANGNSDQSGQEITITDFKEANFEENDLVDLIEKSDTTGVLQVLKAGLEISAVEPQSDGSGKITVIGTIPDSSAGHTMESLVMQGSLNADPEGLKGIVKSSTSGKSYDLDRDRKWSSIEEAAGGAAVSTDLLNKVMLKVEKKCGKVPNLIMCSYEQYEKILNLLEDQKRYTVPTRAGLKKANGADISFSGVEFMSTSGPVGIFPERFCEKDRVYFLNDNHIHIHHRPDFGWFDDDGTVFLRKLDEDAYEARYGGYFQIYINPAFHGVLTGLSS